MRYFRSKIYNSIYLEMEADNAETACERAMAVYGSGASVMYIVMRAIIRCLKR